MQDPEFKSWLLGEKNFGKKTVADVLSRCHRIERHLDISLDDELATEKDLQEMLDTMASNMEPHLKPDAGRVVSVSILRRAVRLYAEFKGLRVVVTHKLYLE